MPKPHLQKTAQYYKLSQRELEVYTQLVNGATYKQITKNLTISPHTTKTHVNHIFTKLNVSSLQGLIVGHYKGEFEGIV